MTTAFRATGSPYYCMLPTQYPEHFDQHFDGDARDRSLEGVIHHHAANEAGGDSLRRQVHVRWRGRQAVDGGGSGDGQARCARPARRVRRLTGGSRGSVTAAVRLDSASGFTTGATLGRRTSRGDGDASSGFGSIRFRGGRGGYDEGEAGGPERVPTGPSATRAQSPAVGSRWSPRQSSSASHRGRTSPPDSP